MRLAWEVRVTGNSATLPVRDRVYVDALDASILLRVPEIHDALNRRVYSANNSMRLPGTLKRGEGQPASGDAYVDATFNMLGLTYACFNTLFGRDSMDGAGLPLISTVHYATSYVNAYWDGTELVCGDGNGVTAGPLCTALDVVAHELTHAVTEYESGLIYTGESGALNESLSDIFGAVCESWSTSWSMGPNVWKVGESVRTPPIAGDAPRYMDDPFLDGDSMDYFEDYKNGADVHTASGIRNLAFKLLSTGGVHPRERSLRDVLGIGIEKAAHIFYTASTAFFTANTTFEQARTYIELAATVLGYDPNTIASVSRAWEAVGVFKPVPQFCPPLHLVPPLSPISGKARSNRYYCANTAANASTVFTLSGGRGDADLYVRFGAPPTKDAFDCRPYLGNSEESCALAPRATAGTYWIWITGFRPCSNVTFSYSN
ncbi:M4 family metallopeptidase [Myxococcus sp. AM011]|uniref:M4 family metallopeptidase n=1 Tax=Myxococcus sp. AM011 TaxID=2745200 RepID=UPI001595E0C8|nr:M4 family metallopeptidase [Myxococcus sp. AM011]NVJ24700.1 M4 family metallopeptidase [Myxococcus sp. AM011]